MGTDDEHNKNKVNGQNVYLDFPYPGYDKIV